MRSGRKLPSTGIATPNKASTTISNGSSSVESGTAPFSPNRNSSPKIMKRFHSRGTASGNVEVMWTWKITIPITASVPITPPLERRSRSGRENSMIVPACAASAARLDGRRSLGVVLVKARLRPARPVPRGVADHHRDDVREMAVELRGRGAPPDADEDDLRGDDQVLEGEQEDQEQEAVDLDPGAEERDLVAQPEQSQGPEQRRDRHGIEPPAGQAGYGLVAGDEQVTGQAQHRRVERDVQQRPARSRRSSAPGRARAAGGPCRAGASRGSRRSSGEKRKVSGIDPQPRPTTSQRSVQTTSFWKTIGSAHQSPNSPRPPRPGVVAEIASAAPNEKTTSLTR